MEKVYEPMRAHRYDEALAALDKSPMASRSRDRVLYLMDRGVLLHLAGRFKESNSALDEADRLAEDLYTLSLSKEAASLMTSDVVLDYEGEDFERVLLNVYKALNYLRLNQPDDAMVECRQVDNKLNVYNSKYEKKNVYREDAFVRYLMGIIFESQGEINDAYISYKKALKIYESDFSSHYGVGPPSDLIASLLRTGQAMGFGDEVDRFRQKYPQIPWMTRAQKSALGEVVFLYADGQAPHKEQYEIQALVPGENYYLKVALPKYVMTPPLLDHAVISDGVGPLSTVEVEPVDRIAVKNLQDRVARITAKAIARAVTKYLAKKGAEAAGEKLGGKGWGFAAGLMVNIAGVVTEQADTRSWMTLPANVQIARFTLPPGPHDLRVRYVDRSGSVRETSALHVNLKPGEAVFFDDRTFE